MQYPFPLLVLVLLLSGCKSDTVPKVEIRPVRTVVVDPKPIDDDRESIGEVKPRYESELSFRVAGKVLSRLVDAGAVVKQGETLASLDTQDYQNRLRSAEADVASAEAALVEAQGAESRLSHLLNNGFTPRANYDTALRNLRSAEAKLSSAKANLDLTRDQLNYTELKADFDGVITAVGAEAGQNVAPGQTVMKLARPGDKDAVFSIAETALSERNDAPLPEVVVWPLSSPGVLIEGQARKNVPPQIRFGTSVGGRVKGSSAPVVVLPIAALADMGGTPAVWVVDPTASTVALKPIAVARYETDRVVLASGLSKGDVVVTAGVNLLREGQRVRLAEAATRSTGQ